MVPMWVLQGAGLPSGRRFSDFVQRRSPPGVKSRPELEVGEDDLVHLLVERSEGNASGTGFLAQPTVHAAADHMDRPNQVKYGKCGRNGARGNDFLALESALIAEAHGTDIAAAVAFDALFKLVEPGDSCLGSPDLLHGWGRPLLGRNRFSLDALVRIGPAAVA